MQKKTSLQLPLISLIKPLIFACMVFSLSACGSSSGEAPSNSTGGTTPTTTTPAPLSTALDNFKTAAADAGLTDK